MGGSIWSFFESGKKMKERCNYYARKGTKDPNLVVNCIIKFLVQNLDKRSLRIKASISK